MLEKQDRKWVKAIGAKLRDDLGDCPTLPEDMLRLLEHMASTRGGRQAKARYQRPTSTTSMPSSATRTSAYAHQSVTSNPEIAIVRGHREPEAEGEVRQPLRIVRLGWDRCIKVETNTEF
jgi:hypothetical protein